MKYLVNVRSIEYQIFTWSLIVDSDSGANQAVTDAIAYLIKNDRDEYAGHNRTWEFHAQPLNDVRERTYDPVLYSAGEIIVIREDNPEVPRFTNFYVCPQCETAWDDTWTATCNDTCPKCGTKDVTPTRLEDV